MNDDGVLTYSSIHLIIASAAIQRVITRKTRQRVISSHPGKDIVLEIAGDHIAQDIADAADGVFHQCQIFHVIRQRVVIQPRNDSVSPCTRARTFRNNVSDVVDIIHVVSVATAHGVGAAATVDTVITVIAYDGVGAIVSPCIKSCPLQDQLFYIRIILQRVTIRRLDGVIPFARLLDDDGVVAANFVGVVTLAANERDAGAGRRNLIVQIITDDRDINAKRADLTHACSHDNFFNIISYIATSNGYEDRVIALTTVLRDLVTSRINVINIITLSAGHAIIASATIQRIEAIRPGELVIAPKPPQKTVSRTCRQVIRLIVSDKNPPRDLDRNRGSIR